jgi:hypothetical protein
MATAFIPPLDYQDYTVDVHLRIYREGSRYGADIFVAGQAKRVMLNLSREDMASLNKQLQQRLQLLLIKGAYGDGEVDLSADYLRPLAELGHFVFRKMFGEHDTWRSLRELLGSSGRVSLQVASEDFFLPWELLYPRSPAEYLSYDGFLGMNSIVSRVIVRPGGSGAFLSPIIAVPSRPMLGLLTCNDLPSVTERELVFFEKLAEEGKIALFKLRALDPLDRNRGIEEFRGFLKKSFNFAHLACEAIYLDEHPNRSHILLADNFSISLQDMEVYEVVIDSHPLVILNACKTGNINPLYTSYFVDAFIRSGARGVVATECLVPDVFAAAFAEQLYKHILSGTALGDSMLRTRRYFLEELNNPSGLLYSMYASPSLRLHRSVVEQKREVDSVA